MRHWFDDLELDSWKRFGVDLVNDVEINCVDVRTISLRELNACLRSPISTTRATAELKDTITNCNNWYLFFLDNEYVRGELLRKARLPRRRCQIESHEKFTSGLQISRK